MSKNGYIPLSEPNIGGNAWKYVKECLDTGWVSSAGGFVEAFERKICEFTGAKHAVAVVNGTSGLQIRS
ncbi:MAG: DegT/DnrJ/EryC1/StrS family aminotransferase, partial [Elusimicrobia bacterium]|nr:DegT/DnrJ/EryC1/StrS family aminotransferase [Elusimicrobiota bacterium]